MAAIKKEPIKARVNVKRAITDVQETLKDINVKIKELTALDKGSKAFAICGWLLMSLSGATLIAVGEFYRGAKDFLGLMIYFLIAMISIIFMFTGYSLAHKGLTGDWL